ncbi:hypothetical protein P9112_005411 [Eukaryota sp. TZLM1-RC]
MDWFPGGLIKLDSNVPDEKRVKYVCNHKLISSILATNQTAQSTNQSNRSNYLILDPDSRLNLLDQHIVSSQLNCTLIVNQQLDHDNLPQSKFDDQSICLYYNTISLDNISSVLPELINLNPVILLVNPNEEAESFFTFVDSITKKHETFANTVLVIKLEKELEKLFSKFYRSSKVLGKVKNYVIPLKVDEVKENSLEFNGYCPVSMLFDNKIVKNHEFSFCYQFNNQFFSFYNKRMAELFLESPDLFLKEFKKIKPPKRTVLVITSNHSQSKLLLGPIKRTFGKSIELINYNSVISDCDSKTFLTAINQSDPNQNDEEDSKDQLSEEEINSKYSEFFDKVNQNLVGKLVENKLNLVLLSPPTNEIKSFYRSSEGQSILIGTNDWLRQISSVIDVTMLIYLEEDVNSLLGRLATSAAINDVKLSDDFELINHFDWIKASRRAHDEQIDILKENLTSQHAIFSQSLSQLFDHCRDNFSEFGFKTRRIILKNLKPQSLKPFFRILKDFSGEFPKFMIKSRQEPHRKVKNDLILSLLDPNQSKMMACSMEAKFLNLDVIVKDLKTNPSNKLVKQTLDHSCGVVSDFDLIFDLLRAGVLFNFDSNVLLLHLDTLSGFRVEKVVDLVKQYSLSFKVSVVGHNVDVINHFDDVGSLDFFIFDQNQSISSFSLDVLNRLRFQPGELINGDNSFSETYFVKNKLHSFQLIRDQSFVTIPACCVHFALTDQVLPRETSTVEVRESEGGKLLCDVSIANFDLFITCIKGFSLFAIPSSLVPQVVTNNSNTRSSIIFDSACPVELSKGLWRRGDQSFLVLFNSNVFDLFNEENLTEFLRFPLKYVHLSSLFFKKLSSGPEYGLLFADNDAINNLPIGKYIEHVFLEPFQRISDLITTNNELKDLVYPGLGVKQTLLLLISLGLRAFNPKISHLQRKSNLAALNLALERCRIKDKEEYELVKNIDFFRLFRSDLSGYHCSSPPQKL